MFFSKFILFLLSSSFLFAANAQQSKGTSAAYKIYEDLPLDAAGKNSAIRSKDNIAEKINDNIFIKTIFSKTKCFVGEPVLLTYELYSALSNKSNISKNPAFQGFTVRQVDFANDDASYKTINDKQFRKFIAGKYVLTPYESGNLVLDPIDIHNVVSYEDGNGEKKDYSGDVSGHTEVISVLPLPKWSGPASFSGAVGKFSVTVKPDKNEFTVNENNHVQVEIKGTGNLSDFSFPVIKWPAGFEVFGGSEKLNDKADSDADFSTSRIYTATIVVKKEGNYTIEPLKVICFNAGEGKYEEVKSQPLQLVVAKNLVEQPVNSFVKPAVAEKGFKWFYILPALLIVALAAVWRAAKNKKQQLALAEQQAALAMKEADDKKAAIDYEALINETLNYPDEKKFLRAFKQVMQNYLIEQTNADINCPEELLIEKMGLADPSKGTPIKELADQCNALLYSPGGVNGQIRGAMVNKFASVLDTTEKAGHLFK